MIIYWWYFIATESTLLLPNQHYCYRYHTVSPQHNRLPYCYRYRPSPDLRTTRKTSLHYTHCYHTTPTIHCYLHDHHDNFPTSHEYYYMSSLTHKHNQSTHTPTCPYSHIHQSDINIDHNHTSTPVNDSSKTLILATQSSTAALPQRHHLSTSITYLLASPSYRTIPRVKQDDVPLFSMKRRKRRKRAMTMTRISSWFASATAILYWKKKSFCGEWGLE